MKTLIACMVILSSSAVLIGCDSSLTNFVRETRPGNIPDPAGNNNANESNGPTALQVSPGNVNATGNGIAMRATATVSSRKFQMGTDRAAVLSINRTRASQQQ